MREADYLTCKSSNKRGVYDMAVQYDLHSCTLLSNLGLHSQLDSVGCLVETSLILQRKISLSLFRQRLAIRACETISAAVRSSETM